MGTYGRLFSDFRLDPLPRVRYRVQSQLDNGYRAVGKESSLSLFLGNLMFFLLRYTSITLFGSHPASVKLTLHGSGSLRT